MPGGQDLIPQTALLTNLSRETAAGSTFIVSLDAKIRPNHVRWARFNTSECPPDAKIRPNHVRWVGFDTAECPPDAFTQGNSGR